MRISVKQLHDPKKAFVAVAEQEVLSLFGLIGAQSWESVLSDLWRNVTVCESVDRQPGQGKEGER